MKTRQEIEKIGNEYGLYGFRSCVMGKNLKYIGPNNRFHCYGHSLINAGEWAEYAFDRAEPERDFKVYSDSENDNFQEMEEEDFILMYPQFFVTPLDYAISRNRKSKKPVWIHQ